METVFLAQVVLGAVVVYVLEWIKRARWVAFITIETKKLNGFLAKAAALLMAVGIHYEFDATAGTLMITGLTIAGLAHGLWVWLQQVVVQELIYNTAIQSRTITIAGGKS